MYARCRTCPELLWVQPTTVAHVAQVRCRACGQAHPLGDVTRLGATPKQHREVATEFSRRHQLDLAGAYSVLLGFMSVQQARAISATERVVELYGLPYEMARKVAAGELRIHEARKLSEPAQSRDSQRRLIFSTTSMQLGVVSGVAGILTVILGVLFHLGRSAHTVDPLPPSVVAPVVGSLASDPPVATPPPSASLPGARVEFDGAGRLVKVAASNPGDVLLAYCRENPARRPLELSSPRNGQDNKWLGVFRDQDNLERLYAVTIYRDKRTRRWSAGDGATPLRAFAIDPDMMGDRRIVVESR